MTPPEIRYDEATGRVAIKTELGGSRDWFIFHPANGGYYTSGDTGPSDVSAWPPYAVGSI